MRRLLCCLLLLGVSLAVATAQDKFAATKRLPHTSKLHTTLLALKEPPAFWKWDAEMRRTRSPLSYQLVNEIMSLAESEWQPSRLTVASFADELANALLGKNMTDAEALMMEDSIDAVLRSTGATFKSASRLRESLAALGVDAARLQIIIKRFIALGEEVRGPDDLPVR